MEIDLGRCVNSLVLGKHLVTSEKQTKGIRFPVESDVDDDIVNIGLDASASKRIKCIEEPSTRLRGIFTIASGDEVGIRIVGGVKKHSDPFKGGLQIKRKAVSTTPRKSRKHY